MSENNRKAALRAGEKKDNEAEAEFKFLLEITHAVDSAARSSSISQNMRAHILAALHQEGTEKQIQEWKLKGSGTRTDGNPS
jgi:hypothetical protein